MKYQYGILVSGNLGAIVLKNIYLLGISELITFPVAAKLFILNLNKK